MGTQTKEKENPQQVNKDELHKYWLDQLERNNSISEETFRYAIDMPKTDDEMKVQVDKSNKGLPAWAVVALVVLAPLLTAFLLKSDMFLGPKEEAPVVAPQKPTVEDVPVAKPQKYRVRIKSKDGNVIYEGTKEEE